MGYSIFQPTGEDYFMIASMRVHCRKIVDIKINNVKGWTIYNIAIPEGDLYSQAKGIYSAQVVVNSIKELPAGGKWSVEIRHRDDIFYCNSVDNPKDPGEPIKSKIKILDAQRYVDNEGGLQFMFSVQMYHSQDPCHIRSVFAKEEKNAKGPGYKAKELDFS